MTDRPPDFARLGPRQPPRRVPQELMSEPQEQLLRRAYAAFNARDIDGALALMHADVDWPNGMEGGRVHGHREVGEYWRRQFEPAVGSGPSSASGPQRRPPAVACGSWSAKSSRRTSRACGWSAAAGSERLVCTTATAAWMASGETCCSSSGYSATQTGQPPGRGRSCRAGSGVSLDELALGLGIRLAVIPVALRERPLQRDIFTRERRIGA